MTLKQYEEKVSTLVGKTINQVIYYEIDYDDGKYHFFDDPRFDSLDFGLQLDICSEHPLTITWGHEFIQYGISFIDGPIKRDQNTKGKLDVSQTSRWYAVLHKKITSAEVFWSWSEELGKPKTRVYYPQDILLTFNSGHEIIVSALEIRENDWFMGMMDHITVFFSTDMAKQFKCLIKT